MRATSGNYGPYPLPGGPAGHHVCSMFARMSRYGPVASGTTRQEILRVAAQPGR